jgi:hypothetical protein
VLGNGIKSPVDQELSKGIRRTTVQLPIPSEEHMAEKKGFDPDRLRTLIEDGKTFSEIKDELKVTSATLKSHLLKLIQLDGKVYKIPEMGTRSFNPKVTKNGLKLSKQKVDDLGFTEGKQVKIEKIADGEIKITQLD